MRNVMAPAGFTIHSMQVVPWKRAAPMCPSTQPAAGAKSPCGRLLASESMLDDGFGTGRAEFVAHTSCQRCVSQSLLETVRWVPSNANVRGMQAAQPWAPNSAADGPASEPPHIRAAHSHINAEQLASAAPSHSASADKHPRTPTIGREAGAEGSMGRTGGWGGREAGAEGSMGGKGAWGGREY